MRKELRYYISNIYRGSRESVCMEGKGAGEVLMGDNRGENDVV